MQFLPKLLKWLLETAHTGNLSTCFFRTIVHNAFIVILFLFSCSHLKNVEFQLKNHYVESTSVLFF